MHRTSEPKHRLARKSVAKPAPIGSATPVHHFKTPHVVNIEGPGAQTSPRKPKPDPVSEAVANWISATERFLQPAASAQEAMNAQFEILRKMNALLPVPKELDDVHTEILLAALMQICNQQSVLAKLAFVLLTECLSSYRCLDVLSSAIQKGTIHGSWIPLDSILADPDIRVQSAAVRVACQLCAVSAIMPRTVNQVLSEYEVTQPTVESERQPMRVALHGRVRSVTNEDAVLAITCSAPAHGVRVFMIPSTRPAPVAQMLGPLLHVKIRKPCHFVITVPLKSQLSVRQVIVAPPMPPRTFKVMQRRESKAATSAAMTDDHLTPAADENLDDDVSGHDTTDDGVLTDMDDTPRMSESDGLHTPARIQGADVAAASAGLLAASTDQAVLEAHADNDQMGFSDGIRDSGGDIGAAAFADLVAQDDTPRMDDSQTFDSSYDGTPEHGFADTGNAVEIDTGDNDDEHMLNGSGGEEAHFVFAGQDDTVEQPPPTLTPSLAAAVELAHNVFAEITSGLLEPHDEDSDAITVPFRVKRMSSVMSST
eukprot:TRINITY_DN15299_c0_g1_i1.p1 TRINITY_DN15299_c0_g1~~TRINITY_DN15299_c0_g1_i1.p1  ORF type:complete len:540 (-),score=130.95 TRINITY_DN15299_c0_g1_i1:462-2081(-)